MSELATGWVRTTLGMLVDYGKAEKAEPDEIAEDSWVLDLEDIEKDSSRLLRRTLASESRPKSTKNRFNAGDVLYGKLRPYLNKVLMADRDGYCTTEIVPLNTRGAVNQRYLFHWMKSPEFLDFVNAQSHGMNMPRLGTEAGKSAPLVLAPLAEQQRIADKLDAILTRVDACRERLDRVGLLVQRFRQSVLQRAVSGTLIAADGGADSWPIRRIGELGTVVTGSTPERVPSAHGSGLMPLFKPSDLGQGVAVRTSEERLTASGAASARLLPARAVLVTCIGATIGKTGLAAVECATNQQINAVVCDEHQVLPEFLYYWLISPAGQAAVIGNASATTLPILNKSKFAGLSIRVPPLEAQRAIVEAIARLFRSADQLELRRSTARRAADRTTPALLAKAFRGELVPQDSADEPADVLLSRLAAVPTERRTRRRGAQVA